MKLVVALVCGVLSGCAFLNGTDGAGLSDLELCQAYGQAARVAARETAATAYRDELNRRGLLTEREWAAVEGRKLFVGMSECGLYASWRRPTRQNRTVAARVERIQHVYGTVGATFYVRPTYVYTENGRVTSWQD